jgi:hypothetical protein
MFNFKKLGKRNGSNRTMPRTFKAIWGMFNFKKNYKEMVLNCTMPLEPFKSNLRVFFMFNFKKMQRNGSNPNDASRTLHLKFFFN